MNESFLRALLHEYSEQKELSRTYCFLQQLTFLFFLIRQFTWKNFYVV